MIQATSEAEFRRTAVNYQSRQKVSKPISTYKKIEVVVYTYNPSYMGSTTVQTGWA
jgi:hypothetical protein